MFINKNSKVLCVLPKYSYGLKEREYSTEYQSFYYSLKNNFKNFFFFNSININKSNSKTNEDLIKIIHRIKPDIIFFSIAYNEIYIETLQKIKSETNSILLNWCSDDSWRLYEHSFLLAPFFDYMLTTDLYAHQQYKLNGFGSILTSWGCPDYWITKPKEFKKCKYDVLFIGSSYFGRDRNIEYLKKKKIKVDCYGYGWPKKPLNYLDVKKKINNSKIALNFSKSRKGVLQTKARVFENTGCGSMCISEKSKDLRKYFKSNEVVDFVSIVDLEKKIKFYLRNPEKRDAVAIKGFEKCKKKYSYSAIIKKIFFNRKLVIKKSNLDIINKLINNKVSFLNQFISFLFKLLLNLTISIFKKQIPKKIIRRIFFELEWRTSGFRTYSKYSLINTIDEIF